MPIRITARDLTDMCRHHFGCAVDGYLGSPYGSDVKAILQSPMAAGLADGVIAKAMQDVPLLRAAPPGAVNLFKRDIDMDKQEIVLEIGGELVPLDGGNSGGTIAPYSEPAPDAYVALSGADLVSKRSADTLDETVNVDYPHTTQDFY